MPQFLVDVSGLVQRSSGGRVGWDDTIEVEAVDDGAAARVALKLATERLRGSERVVRARGLVWPVDADSRPVEPPVIVHLVD
jgi:hypothetical protein